MNTYNLEPGDLVQVSAETRFSSPRYTYSVTGLNVYDIPTKDRLFRDNERLIAVKPGTIAMFIKKVNGGFNLVYFPTENRDQIRMIASNYLDRLD